MKYTLSDNRKINIPDNEIQKSIEKLGISENEAIQLWLEDNGYQVNPEQAELQEKAENADVGLYEISEEKKKKPRKKRIVNNSNEKIELFNTILANLDRCNGVSKENIKILIPNKSIDIKVGEKWFNINLIQHRTPKNDEK